MSPQPVLTIYHNARCSKSRATLEHIQKAGRECTIVNYLEHPPTPEELDRILRQLSKSPEEIIRKGEDRYDELGLRSSDQRSREEWIQILCENPILIERPIVTDGSRAILGRPPENVLQLLG